MGEAGTKRGAAASWEIVDMATVPSDILSLYNEMKNAYEGGKETEYFEARERFYHAMIASITHAHAVRPDQKVSIKFTPAMVQVAITPRKDQGKNGIVRGTFKLGELPSKVRRLGVNPLQGHRKDTAPPMRPQQFRRRNGILKSSSRPRASSRWNAWTWSRARS